VKPADQENCASKVDRTKAEGAVAGQSHRVVWNFLSILFQWFIGWGHGLSVRV